MKIAPLFYRQQLLSFSKQLLPFLLSLLQQLLKGRQQLIPIPIPVKDSKIKRMGAALTILCIILVAQVTAHPLPVNKVATPVVPPSESLVTNLYAVVNNSNSLADGNLVMFDNTSSNAVDINDIRKLNNFGENFGLTRDGVILVVEKRALLSDNDTIFYDMSNLNTITYKMEIVANNLNHPNMIGILEDSYLGSRTLINLNDTTNYTFSVNSAAGSYARKRFRIVFSAFSGGPLLVNFASLQAIENNAAIVVNWQVVSQLNTIEYQVERSSDGLNFSTAAVQQAVGSYDGEAYYSWKDEHARQGNNYYRIKGVELNGIIKYSPIAKVMKKVAGSGIFISPNPVVGNELHCNFVNYPKGNYNLRLVGNNGTAFAKSNIAHGGINTIYTVSLPANCSAGIYQLEIIKPTGNREVQQVMIIGGQ